MEELHPLALPLRFVPVASKATEGTSDFLNEMERDGGIEPLDFHPTVYCHRLRTPMWERLASE